MMRRLNRINRERGIRRVAYIRIPCQEPPYKKKWSCCFEILVAIC